MNFIKDCTRMMSLWDVRMWHEGQTKELKKLIGVGMDNSLFVSEKGTVIIYYNEPEGLLVFNKIKELLTDEFFDNICDNFYELVEEIDSTTNIADIFRLGTMMIPALIVFDEIDNCSEIATPYIKRRLKRIRESTHEKSYDLSKKVPASLIMDYPKDYMFWKGKVYTINSDLS